jgi:hypothetical protein
VGTETGLKTGENTVAKMLSVYVAAAAALSAASARLLSDPNDAAKQQAVEDARATVAGAGRDYREALAARGSD